MTKDECLREAFTIKPKEAFWPQVQVSNDNNHCGHRKTSYQPTQPQLCPRLSPAQSLDFQIYDSMTHIKGFG